MADQFNEAELEDTGAMVGNQFLHDLVIAAIDQGVQNGIANLRTASDRESNGWSFRNRQLAGITPGRRISRCRVDW